jgi:RND family efflux transporter MFP subunit
MEHADLLAYDGEPEGFWSGLAAHLARKMGARQLAILLHRTGAEELRVLAATSQGARSMLAQAAARKLADLICREGGAHESPSGAGSIAGFDLSSSNAGTVFTLAELPEGASDTLLEDLRELAGSLAELYQARRQAARVGGKFDGVREVLDLGLLMGEARHFREAGFRLCNEAAARFDQARVSLGWLDGGILKLVATSHAGKVDRRTEQAGRIEAAMEEALDQDNEVCYPPLEGSTAIHHVHESYARACDGAKVLSLPIRQGGKPAGVLFIEQASDWRGWQSADLETLRLMLDLAGTRLSDLHRRSGWFGKRLWRSAKERASGPLGPRGIGWKLVGLALVFLVLLLAVIRIDHKVKAPFILRTEAATRVSAPYPGFLAKVAVRVGDVVKAGDLLIELDRKELELQRVDAEAELNTARREAQRLEGEGNLSGMRVARLQAEQAEAKLAIIRHRLEQSVIRAPFDGIVVEGDLDQKLLAPVQAGEALLRIVQVRDLYGQLQVDERDVQYLRQGQEGELAFVGRPDEKFRVGLQSFEPVAQVKEQGTVFLLRAGVLDPARDWWRPGMSGVCKIPVGKRSILWILSHRTIEFLRLHLWI